MNKWQKIFTLFAAVAIVILFVCPPQYVTDGSVKFLPITYGHPVDWFRLFMWILAVLFVCGLGVAINKEEHK